MPLKLRLSLFFLPAVLLALFAPNAGALALTSASSEVGWISLSVSGTPGDVVRLAETRAGAPIEFTSVTLNPAGTADLQRALPWRCDTRTRALSAVDPSGASASTTIKTPSCKKRLAVKVRPTKPRVGRKAKVTVRDLWKLGNIAARICRTPAGGLGRSCEELDLPEGGGAKTYSFRLRRAGLWKVSVGLPGATTRRAIKVTPRGGRLRVLATGDSMIQIVDEFLKQRLRKLEPTRFRSDAHISTGISKPQLLNWTRHAASSARGFRPDVTVVFLGANDGFNMSLPGGGVATCCGNDWVEEYARRARSMMRDYERSGAGNVYWLLLPAPRPGSWRGLFRRVNDGIELAAKESETTHLVDLRKTFTPSGRFQQRIKWRGRRVSVRAGDGIHLNVNGARIAAEIVVRTLRRDGVSVR